MPNLAGGPLTDAVCRAVSVPVVASGGAGTMPHFAELFRATGADAGLSAGAFHTRTLLIPELKRHLRDQGIPVRLEDGGAGPR